MTLIITLAGPSGIHQSADFRLTTLRQGRPSTLLSDASPKQVTLNYGVGAHAWQAVAAYAGVGAHEHLDTCSWLVRWLNPSGEWPVELSFVDAIACIQSQGTSWLHRMSLALGYLPRHTFVIAALVANKPQVVIISNCERVGQMPSDDLTSELVVTRLHPRKPMVIVTGQTDALTRVDRRLLCSMLRSQVRAKRIREKLAGITKMISESSGSQSTVSPAAMAYSLLPEGSADSSGGGEKYGDVDGDFIPNGLSLGMETHTALRMVLQHMGSRLQIPEDNRHG